MERSRALLTEKRAAGARLEEELAALREDEVDITAAIRQKQGANATLQARLPARACPLTSICRADAAPSIRLPEMDSNMLCSAHMHIWGITAGPVRENARWSTCGKGLPIAAVIVADGTQPS